MLLLIFEVEKFTVSLSDFVLLHYNKWPLGIDPGGHNFVVLNVSINKKRFFVSQVVQLTHYLLPCREKT